MPSVKSTLRWEEECAGSKVISAKARRLSRRSNFPRALLKFTLGSIVALVQCNIVMEAMREVHKGGRVTVTVAVPVRPIVFC
ncbi:hypothetical protein GCM10007920_26200 [Ciceribacter naphthalenivorans]|uniref:Uncharacterized protein n=2 Tax=Alphaproteobacteria TaxID=28211 RepID=A0A512HHH2_9HYPH|nr:hypothetical protein RNA01_18300 [Ciceribacter naphthalenivorans]GLR22832.1 hypothetical protein GCM10007920_26200 [Ciceribacter naphthalenivorans]GLT05688.1 hypothetical protein GCM10007926_26200 [Sphingomonas psychrolutea]